MWSLILAPSWQRDCAFETHPMPSSGRKPALQTDLAKSKPRGSATSTWPALPLATSQWFRGCCQLVEHLAQRGTRLATPKLTVGVRQRARGASRLAAAKQCGRALALAPARAPTAASQGCPETGFVGHLGPHGRRAAALKLRYHPGLPWRGVRARAKEAWRPAATRCCQQRTRGQSLERAPAVASRWFQGHRGMAQHSSLPGRMLASLNLWYRGREQGPRTADARARARRLTK